MTMRESGRAGGRGKGGRHLLHKPEFDPLASQAQLFCSGKLCTGTIGGQAEGEGLSPRVWAARADDLGPVPSAQLEFAPQNYPLEGLQEPPSSCTRAVRPSRRCPEVLPDTGACPAPPPARPSPARRGGDGREVRGADGKQSPTKALLPVAVFCLLPRSRGHKRPLSGARPMQCAGRRATGEHGWACADALERARGTAGDTARQLQLPTPLLANTPSTQAPPRTLTILVAVCVSERASTQPLRHPRPLPASSARHKSTGDPSVGRRGPTPMVKAQLEPSLQQGL